MKSRLSFVVAVAASLTFGGCGGDAESVFDLIASSSSAAKSSVAASSSLAPGSDAVSSSSAISSVESNGSSSVHSSLGSLDATNGYDIRTKQMTHPSAYIAQMCYTETEDADGRAHNPCFSCHTTNQVPNYVLDDEELQGAYDFPAPALQNPFANHFIDFSDAVAAISDETIMAYVDEDNYRDANGSIILAGKLAELPLAWDYDGDGNWTGYTPDCYFDFDEYGLDRDPQGGYTGWAAFAYYPFLGTFWPTNGSTDDVLIRLDTPFRMLQEGGDFNRTVYMVNLAVVDAMIKRSDVPIEAVDERALGVDLDKDGALGIAETVVYDWAPLEERYMYYVGYAKTLLEQEAVHIAAGLFPEETEFLHSVRYIQSDTEGNITLAPRMKELRYARKVFWLTYATLQNKGLALILDKDLNPDQLETFGGNMEIGLGSNLGWLYQGFIEDKYGDLRPQSYEELLNCMGCHSGLSATTDGTFAFARKFDATDAFQHGWYHWTQKGLKGVPELILSDGTYEYSNYLERNEYGDEFRENDEVIRKFYHADGSANQTMFDALHDDITVLINPSHERALQLNKAYKALVETQRFIDGKAAHVTPFKNVHTEVEQGQSTGNEIYEGP